jgi:hypothetical protein
LGLARVKRCGAVFACVAALSCGLPAAGWASPGELSPRAAIAFLPGPAPQSEPSAIERLAGLRAVGFVSAIMGAYTPEQSLLDLSGGARTWTSLYDGELITPMSLVRSGAGGRVRGFHRAAERARTAPADVVPGTLAQSVLDAGGEVAYVGLEGRSNREAIVASDREGRVERVELTRRRAVGSAAARAWRDATLLVARLPSGRDGREAIDQLRRARGRSDLLLVVQQPGGLSRRLLAIGADGLGEGSVRSDATRTKGIVVSSDVARTVLERLGVPVPDDVEGESIEAAGGRDIEGLEGFRDRLAEVGPRRWTVVIAGLAGAVLLGLLLPPSPRHPVPDGWGRRAAAVAFPAAVWLPAVLLLTGLVAPSRPAEVALIAAGCALLALAVRPLRPWPWAVALAAGVSVAAQLADLALGSPLTARSLLGPNPILGARFYGAGNELEAALAVIGLVGIGAALAKAPPRALAWGLGLAAGGLALVLSWGRVGADVGASIMLAAGGAAAVLAALGGRFTRRRLLVVVAAPVLALAMLALLDIATGGDSHFTRSVLRAGGLGELADVAQRRIELSYRSLGRGIIWLLVAVAIAGLALGLARRRALLAPLEGYPGPRAALYGALVAVVVGALSNDSGPIVLLIGAIYLALAVAWFATTAPREEGPKPAARTPR